jgi:hypothetical protein
MLHVGELNLRENWYRDKFVSPKFSVSLHYYSNNIPVSPITDVRCAMPVQSTRYQNAGLYLELHFCPDAWLDSELISCLELLMRDTILCNFP